VLPTTKFTYEKWSGGKMAVGPDLPGKKEVFYCFCKATFLLTFKRFEEQQTVILTANILMSEKLFNQFIKVEKTLSKNLSRNSDIIISG
jgi:hypothetical protein